MWVEVYTIVSMKSSNEDDTVTIDGIPNFPEGATIQRSNGHIYVIRRNYVRGYDGRLREVRQTLGQIVDNVFYEQTEYKRKFQRGMVERDSPRICDIINSPEVLEGLTKDQIFYLSEQFVSGTVGTVPLFWELAKDSGLYNDLSATFQSPVICAKILSIAIYFIVTGDNSARHFYNFAMTHYLPYNKQITSQAMSDFYRELASCNEFLVKHFFIQRAKRITKNDELICIDSTTVPSSASRYSLTQVGKSKKGIIESQINFAVVFKYHNHEPICYRTIPGNIPDCVTLLELLTDLEYINVLDKCIATLDRGYCSIENIALAQDRNFKCCIALTLNSRWSYKAIEKALPHLNHTSNLIHGGEVYAYTVEISEKDPTGNTRIFWVHVFKSLRIRHNEVCDFMRQLEEFEHQWISSQVTNVKKLLKNRIIKYFKYDKDDLARPLVRNQEEIDRELKYAGCFANITTYQCSAKESFETYDLRDDIERLFRSAKQDINFNVLRVHSDAYSQGKLFVIFISLIMLEHAKQELAKDRYKSDKNGKPVLEIAANTFDIDEVINITKSLQFHRRPRSGECFFLHPSAKQNNVALAMGQNGLFMRNFKY